jgi:hypothetical protein
MTFHDWLSGGGNALCATLDLPSSTFWISLRKVISRCKDIATDKA